MTFRCPACGHRADHRPGVRPFCLGTNARNPKHRPTLMNPVVRPLPSRP